MAVIQKRGGCTCYWGCATTANRAVWAVLTAVFVFGIVFSIVGGVKRFDAVKKYNNCVDHLGKAPPTSGTPSNDFTQPQPPVPVWVNGAWQSPNPNQSPVDLGTPVLPMRRLSETRIFVTDDQCFDAFKRHFVAYQALFFIGLTLCILVGPIMTSYFCCCANPPAEYLPDGAASVTVVQLGGAAEPIKPQGYEYAPPQQPYPVANPMLHQSAV